MKIILKCVLGAVCLVAFMSVAWAGEQVTVVPDTDGVQRVTMTVDSHFYKPDHLVVRAGVPVELILISRTTFTPHNFVLKEPNAGIDINKEIGAGETVKVRFTPTKAGVFTFFCDKKLLFFKSHRDKGMEGIVKVQ
jgi:plastocyanin domain-containing protein